MTDSLFNQPIDQPTDQLTNPPNVSLEEKREGEKRDGWITGRDALLFILSGRQAIKDT